ncbi:MAG: hypothetical protein RLY87_1592 [Chloroflexota bacterium]
MSHAEAKYLYSDACCIDGDAILWRHTMRDRKSPSVQQSIQKSYVVVSDADVVVTYSKTARAVARAVWVFFQRNCERLLFYGVGVRVCVAVRVGLRVLVGLLVRDGVNVLVGVGVDVLGMMMPRRTNGRASPMSLAG